MRPGRGRVWLSLVVILVAVTASAQPDLQDPLADLDGASVVERVDALNEAALAVVQEDPERALELAERAAGLARREGSELALGAAEYAIGEAHYVRDDSTAALPHLLEAERLLRDGNDSVRLARAMRRIGDVRSKTGAYEEALEMYLDTLRLLEALDAQDPGRDRRWDIGNLLGAIGNLFRHLKERERALDYYQRSLQIYEELEFTLGIAGASYNVGNLLYEAGDYDSALDHYLRARETAALLDDPTLLSMATTSVGTVFLEKGSFDVALQRFAESLEMCRAAGRQRGVLFNLKGMGNAQSRQQHFARAVDHYREALLIAVDLDDGRMQGELHELLSVSLAGMGDHAAALDHYRRFVAIQDEIFNEARSRQIHELEIAYESEKKDQQIEILNREREIQRWMRAALILATVLAVAVAALGWSRYRLGVRAARDIEHANEELTRALARVEQLSRTDYLTGLPNRRCVVERVTAGLDHASTNAVVLADIDDFKRVNDRFGHECGDFVLVSVAQHLRSLIRVQDVVGRWGGEEFILILPDTDQPGAGELVERIRWSIETQAFLYKGTPVKVTLTFGVSSIGGGISFEDSLRRADRALYSGKQSGKNQVVLEV